MWVLEKKNKTENAPFLKFIRVVIIKSMMQEISRYAQLLCTEIGSLMGKVLEGNPLI